MPSIVSYHHGFIDFQLCHVSTLPIPMVYTRCFHWWHYCASAFLFAKFRVNRLYSEVEETLEI